jgi:hypothetical protein
VREVRGLAGLMDKLSCGSRDKANVPLLSMHHLRRGSERPARSSSPKNSVHVALIRKLNLPRDNGITFACRSNQFIFLYTLTPPSHSPFLYYSKIL